jgi:YidC/Oxa1 family membrane protein insertase
VTGLLSAHGLVFAGLIALLAVVGWASARLARRLNQAAPVPAPATRVRPAARKKQARAGQARAGQARAGEPQAAVSPAAGAQGRAVAGLTAVLPYVTAVVALFVPLAAGIYLLTTTAWTLAERAALRRRAQEAADRSAAARARTALS